jgi:hypothetical protein
MGRAGYDITAKSENWRRGYYEAMMLLAQAAEHVDGWVRDRKRDFYFPPEFVIGDSNPRPKPIPSGNVTAPREEDCEIPFETADNHYLRILTTRGFTSRQKIDAALACAAFMEFKELPDAAERMYDWALSLAAEGASPSSIPYDTTTYALRDQAAAPSANLLVAMTAMATHKARSADVSSALPIFLSLLRARRSLSKTPPTGKESRPVRPPSTADWIRSIIFQPPYPPPPDDGTAPPWRDAKNMCEEAALELYIGEILYSLKGSNREEGLSWTRDAVDIAEEQLRRLGIVTAEKEAQATCRQCLSTGLESWFTMVDKLATEEEEKKKEAPAKSSGFVFWSKPDDSPADRWAAEQKVVAERTRRTQELLDDLRPENAGIYSLLKA